MAQQNNITQNNPTLTTKEIQDVYVRKNFINLQSYFNSENQLLGFQFVELVFTKATANYLFAHGCKNIPQDIVITQITGSGKVTFNNGLFDATNGNITVTGACRVRFFIGTYWNYTSSAGTDPGSFMEFQASISNSIINNTTTTNLTNNQVFLPISYADTVNKTYGPLNTDVSTYYIRAIDNVVYVPTATASFTVTLPKCSESTGSQITIYKYHNNFFPVTINVAAGTADYIEEPGSFQGTVPTYGTTPSSTAINTTNVSTFQERVTLVSTGTFWRVVHRDYFRGWLTYPVPNLYTNGLINGITLNTGVGYVAPTAYFRREGPEMIVKYGFRNGTGGAATGAAGTFSFPMPTLGSANSADLNVRPSDGAIGSNDGYAWTNRAGNYKGQENALLVVSGGGSWLQIQVAGTASYYALTDLVAGFAMEGVARFSITGWR